MRRYAAAVIAFVSSVRPPERVASLQTRLLIAASLVLLAFLGLTGLSLERAFRNSTLAAIQERLQAQVYMLLGAAELDQEGRFTLPEELPEARFSTPGSGLDAQSATTPAAHPYRKRLMALPYLTGGWKTKV